MFESCSNVVLDTLVESTDEATRSDPLSFLMDPGIRREMSPEEGKGREIRVLL